MKLKPTGETRAQRQVRRSEDGRWTVTPAYEGWSRSGVSRANRYRISDATGANPEQTVFEYAQVAPRIESMLRREAKAREEQS